VQRTAPCRESYRYAFFCESVTLLRALGTELSVISVCSFACKAVLALFKFFNVLRDGSSLYLSLSSVLVEALPTILTMGLLARYHSRSAGAARGEPAMSDIGASLLQM
jgi:hypothetical protein